MLSSNSHYQELYCVFKEQPHKRVVLFACDVVRLVVPIYEKQLPSFTKTKDGIVAAEKFAMGMVDIKEVVEASSLAWKEGSLRMVYGMNRSSVHALDAVWTVIHVTKENTDVVIGTLNAIRGAARAAKIVNIDLWKFVNDIFKQFTSAHKIPITPQLKAIAMGIAETRNFNEYNVLLDNLEEEHNITLPREMPLGLSHYVLSQLLVQT